ncbi:MAG TPA: ABC transporter permease, partial [Flavobacterium sp.]|nr:ABC transporter permease [Flavobacterium sp.]
MVRYIIHKIGYALLTMFGVVTVVFFLFNILPGDPARMMLDQNENSEQLAIIKKKYGFDQPIYKQYLLYLNDISPVSVHSKKTDDYSFFSDKYNGKILFETSNNQVAVKTPYLRESFQKNGKPVTDIIAGTLPNTIFLACFAIGIAIVVGLVLGVFSALY